MLMHTTHRHTQCWEIQHWLLHVLWMMVIANKSFLHPWACDLLFWLWPLWLCSAVSGGSTQTHSHKYEYQSVSLQKHYTNKTEYTLKTRIVFTHRKDRTCSQCLGCYTTELCCKYLVYRFSLNSFTQWTMSVQITPTAAGFFTENIPGLSSLTQTTWLFSLCK